MRYIQKFFESKKSVERFVEEHGMEAAVQEYGINKLVMFKILAQYEETELYHDDISFEDKVYNNTGKLLGCITDLMCPFYKSAGAFFGPCTNGNIILCRNDREQGPRTYGVFDKFGNQLVEYGKYFDKCFLPNGVALINPQQRTEVNVTTVTYNGEVKEQDYTYIKECFVNRTCGTDVKSYKIYKPKGNQVTISVIHLNKNGEEVDLDEKIKETEKGIE